MSSPAWHLVDERPSQSAEIIEWKVWQYGQSLSTRTVEERAGTVLRCAAWAKTDPQSIRPEQISAWLASGDWSKNTRWTYHTNLAAWFRWLLQMEYRADDPMTKVGRPRRAIGEPRPVTEENIRRLLRSGMHSRTRAMILLAALQGLRAHEIAKIKGEHLDLVARMMVVTGKGGVKATLPLHPMVVDHAYQMPRKGHWFPGPDSGHQHRESVSGTIKVAMARAGVPGSAHCLRHWFGTALVRAGVDLRTVQTLMRHQNLASTAIYTQVADEQRVKGIRLLDPFGLTAMELPETDIGVSVGELRHQANQLLAAADRLEAR